MNLNDYAAEVHAANAKWWHDIETGECLEGVRKNLMDDKLPHRTMEEVEMADALIRILDYCAGHGLDIEGAYQEKMRFNASRIDHTTEARLADGGKKF